MVEGRPTNWTPNKGEVYLDPEPRSAGRKIKILDVRMGSFRGRRTLRAYYTTGVIKSSIAVWRLRSWALEGKETPGQKSMQSDIRDLQIERDQARRAIWYLYHQKKVPLSPEEEEFVYRQYQKVIPPQGGRP